MEETTNIADVAAQTTKENISYINKLLTSAIDYIEAFLPTLIFALIVLAIGIILSRIILKMIMKALAKSRVDDTVCGFLKSLLKIVLYVIVFIIFLSLLSVPMTSIITVLGTAGLAIGLALKDSLSNVAGGFIILFSKPLKSGDTIEYDGTVGIVEQVNILSTTLRTNDNATVHIPNGKIADSKIINYSEKPTRGVDIEVAVSYNEDIDKVKNVLKKIFNGYNKILKTPEPGIFVSKHGDSAIIFLIRPWVKTEDYWEVKFYLTEKIKKEFDKNNIEIPYPQMDIHESKNA